MKTFPASILCLLCAGPLGAQTPADFTTTVQKAFAGWDSNHDGVLSAKELDAAVSDPKTTNENAAAAAALKRASVQTKDALPPLTLGNIASLAAERKPDLALMFAQAMKRISHAGNRELFPGGLPAIETIRQGKIGNCFCLAPLGALVHRDPAQVAGMFSLQSDGTYCVRLGKKTVQVSLPTDAEIAMGSANDGGGIWVNLYEKAVGTARNEDRPVEKRVDLPLDAERGGSAGTMLAYVTGHEIVRFSFKFAKESATTPEEFAAKLTELRGRMTEATRQNRLMTCGTTKTTTPGLSPNHAYAVLGYDVASDSVRLWNPHGEGFSPKGAPGLENGYATANGVFDIPADHFVRQFSGMAFEVTEAKTAGAGKAADEPILAEGKSGGAAAQ